MGNDGKNRMAPGPFIGDEGVHPYEPRPGLHPDPQGTTPKAYEPEMPEQERIDSNVIVTRVRENFSSEIIGISDFRGDLSIGLHASAIIEVCKLLRDDPELAFDLFIDICAVHYPRRKDGEFEVVYHLYSLTHNRRVRLKVPLSRKKPEVPSIHEIFKGANWFEREAFDMVGVMFTGHPNLRRLLTHEEFVGHPLRRDYPYWKRQKLSKPYPVIRDGGKA